ncbi:MAG: LLM class flavin-dependent oxidoreductase [Gammaproteobacteria bacterium]|jgi:alkanesulfonate monooxygenase SsuD/methylene tetrahydromethanopterin reductase-like flavin-dependent oxidoreductase (luciferase family)|nr:LLM class flavin-dependent oxidoreductase [Gammaproteobacteria bacterium]
MRLDLVLEPASPGVFAELGLLAERLGFGNVWTANHIAARDPFMSFMPLAARSQRIGMGPIAISPYELHPVKIANQLLTLNEAAQGRARVVIGGGGGTVIGLGMKPGRRAMMPRMVRAVREAVELVRGAATGRLFSYDGELFSVANYQASWTADLPPPMLYVGASKPQMLRMAGRVADGVMMSDVTLPRIAEAMAALTGSLHEQGRTEYFPVSNLYAWHVFPDRAQALAEARAKLFVRGMLEDWYISPFLDAAECAQVEASFNAFAMAYARNSPVIEGVPDALVEKLVENLTFVGTPQDVDQITEELLAFKAAGLNEFAIRLYAEPAAAMQLIAERVMPALA